MRFLLVAAAAVAALVVSGCRTPLPPGAEPGPHRTMAYYIDVEASEPGAKIEANGELVGQTPMRLKVFGDPDGTFHDFGSLYFVVRALPVTTNQYAQTRVFYTGHMLGPEDRIPKRIYFDMSQPPAVHPYPPSYYAPPPSVYVVPPPVYYGPGVRFHFGPRIYRHW